MDAPAPVEKRGPPKFKQRAARTFKSKAPKPGQKGFGDDIPGMEGLGTGKDWRLSRLRHANIVSVF